MVKITTDFEFDLGKITLEYEVEHFLRERTDSHPDSPETILEDEFEIDILRLWINGVQFEVTDKFIAALSWELTEFMHENKSLYYENTN